MNPHHLYSIWLLSHGTSTCHALLIWAMPFWFRPAMPSWAGLQQTSLAFRDVNRDAFWTEKSPFSMWIGAGLGEASHLLSRPQWRSDDAWLHTYWERFALPATWFSGPAMVEMTRDGPQMAIYSLRHHHPSFHAKSSYASMIWQHAKSFVAALPDCNWLLNFTKELKKLCNRGFSNSNVI